jgi:hypothetical protein
MADILGALGDLLDIMFENLGPQATVGAILVFFVMVCVYRYLAFRYRERGYRDAIQAKEASIQRLADDNRVYRVEQLKSKGWKREDIDRYVLGGPFRNARESREHWEQGDVLDDAGDASQGR